MQTNSRCSLEIMKMLCSSRAEEEQNSKDLINQQRTNGAEDTELTRILKSSKVCTLELDHHVRTVTGTAAPAAVPSL